MFISRSPEDEDAEWPFRKKRLRDAFAQRASQTDGVDGAKRTWCSVIQEPVCAPAAPALQTTKARQDKRDVNVSCTSPVWHNGPTTRRDPPACDFPLSSNASSRSTAGASSSELPRNCFDPFGANFFSAAPAGLLQQASLARDSRSFIGVPLPMHEYPTIAPLDAPSCIDSFTRFCVSSGVPMPEGQPTARPSGGTQGTTRPSGGAQGGMTLEASLSREQSCVEAVMEYLEGPLVGNFDFMFEDEEEGAAAGA